MPHIRTTPWKEIPIEGLPQTPSFDDVTGKDGKRKALQRISRGLASARLLKLTISKDGPTQLPIINPSDGICILEITVQAGVTVVIPIVQKRDIRGFLLMQMRIEKDAQVEFLFGCFGGAEYHAILDTVMSGDSSHLSQRTIFFGNRAQQFEIFSTTKLKGKNCTAEISASGIVTDTACARFDGAILIEKTGRGGNAKLNEHALMLSPHCKVSAIPRLKIDTNDVAASHSASMTRVDQDQLFYSASRGIPESEGIRMIAEGFLRSAYVGTPIEEACKKIADEKLRTC